MAHKFQHILPHQLHRAGGPAEAHSSLLCLLWGAESAYYEKQ